MAICSLAAFGRQLNGRIFILREQPVTCDIASSDVGLHRTREAHVPYIHRERVGFRSELPYTPARRCISSLILRETSHDQYATLA